jgi:hypothetical protein
VLIVRSTGFSSMPNPLLQHPNTRQRHLTPGVVKRLEREIRYEEVPTVFKLGTWRSLLQIVEESEDMLLDDEKDAEAVKCHRGILETPILLGEHLLALPDIGEALKALKCTPSDLEAKITTLRYKDRVWHGDLNAEKSHHIVTALFSGDEKAA